MLVETPMPTDAEDVTGLRDRATTLDGPAADDAEGPLLTTKHLTGIEERTTHMVQEGELLEPDRGRDDRGPRHLRSTPAALDAGRFDAEDERCAHAQRSFAAIADGAPSTPLDAAITKDPEARPDRAEKVNGGRKKPLQPPTRVRK